jgi:hypothetical protein
MPPLVFFSGAAEKYSGYVHLLVQTPHAGQTGYFKKHLIFEAI